MFDIGEKIVCINDSGFPHQLVPRTYVDFPKKGEIYTVRDIVPAGSSLKDCAALNANNVAVLLDEIVNPVNSKGFESGYNHARFKSLEELTEEEELSVGSPIEADAFAHL